MLGSNAADEDWDLLLSFFPSDWMTLAGRSGALKGLRQDKSAENLLRVLGASRSRESETEERVLAGGGLRAGARFRAASHAVESEVGRRVHPFGSRPDRAVLRQRASGLLPSGPHPRGRRTPGSRPPGRRS